MPSLLEAIRKGDEKAAESILSVEPGLADTAGENGVSALLLARYQGKTSIQRMLLARRKAPLDVFEAAAYGDATRVRQLLASDASAASARSADGFSPLHLASYFGQFAAAQALLDAGAPVNDSATNGSGLRPLHSAAAGSDPGAAFDLASLLLERGADPSARQKGGYTALHSAAASGNLPLAQLLAEAGADPAARADDGKTPLDLARERGHAELVKFLGQ